MTAVIPSRTGLAGYFSSAPVTNADFKPFVAKKVKTVYSKGSAIGGPGGRALTAQERDFLDDRKAARDMYIKYRDTPSERPKITNIDDAYHYAKTEAAAQGRPNFRLTGREWDFLMRMENAGGLPINQETATAAGPGTALFDVW